MNPKMKIKTNFFGRDFGASMIFFPLHFHWIDCSILSDGRSYKSILQSFLSFELSIFRLIGIIFFILNDLHEFFSECVEKELVKSIHTKFSQKKRTNGIQLKRLANIEYRQYCALTKVLEAIFSFPINYQSGNSSSPEALSCQPYWSAKFVLKCYAGRRIVRKVKRKNYEKL